MHLFLELCFIELMLYFKGELPSASPYRSWGVWKISLPAPDRQELSLEWVSIKSKDVFDLKKKKNVSEDLKRSTLGRPLQPVLPVSAGDGQLNATLSTTCATYLKCKQHKHPNCDRDSSSVEEREKHTADSCVYAVTVEWVHESYT